MPMRCPSGLTATIAGPCLVSSCTPMAAPPTHRRQRTHHFLFFLFSSRQSPCCSCLSIVPRDTIGSAASLFSPCLLKIYEKQTLPVVILLYSGVEVEPGLDCTFQTMLVYSFLQMPTTNITSLKSAGRMVLVIRLSSMKC